MIDGGQRIIIAYAVQTVGIVVVGGGSALGNPVFHPILRMGGEVVSIVGEGFGKLTLLISKPSAKPVVGVVPLPVVGQAAPDPYVVPHGVIDKVDRLLAGRMDDPRPAGRG